MNNIRKQRKSHASITAMHLAFHDALLALENMAGLNMQFSRHSSSFAARANIMVGKVLFQVYNE